MGRTVDDLDEHEGYVLAVMADGSETGTWPDSQGCVGHRSGCECGWRGTVSYDNPGQDLYSGDGSAGDMLMLEWERHVQPLRAIQPVAAAQRAVVRANDRLREAVAIALNEGASMGDIATELGLSEQEAQQRFTTRRLRQVRRNSTLPPDRGAPAPLALVEDEPHR